MSLVEFEKHKVVKSFMEACDVYYTNLGGYHYSKDRSPCYYLNGMLTMFEEQQKKIGLLETELTETQTFLNKQNHIKQTKIDEITKQRDSFIKAHHISMNDVCEHKDKIDEVNEKHSEEKRILHNVIEMNQAKIDELQARFDDASNKIDFWVGGKNGDAIHVAKSIGNILKGNIN